LALLCKRQNNINFDYTRVHKKLQFACPAIQIFEGFCYAAEIYTPIQFNLNYTRLLAVSASAGIEKLLR
jgi:hypothetical protein